MFMPVCQSPGAKRTRSKTSRINSANWLFSSKDSVRSAAKAANASVFLCVFLCFWVSEIDAARRADAGRFFKIENGWIFGHLLAVQVPTAGNCKNLL